MFSLFKFDNVNCKFVCGDPTPCPDRRPNAVNNNYDSRFLQPFIQDFKDNKEVYEICITIKPQLLNIDLRNKIWRTKGTGYDGYGKSHLDIYNMINTKIINFLKKFKLKSTKILLVSEYSETKRLHFHGCITKPFSPEMCDILSRLLTKYIGRTVIKDVRHINYFTYMTKDVHKEYSIPTCMVFNI